MVIRSIGVEARPRQGYLPARPAGRIEPTVMSVVIRWTALILLPGMLLLLGVLLAARQQTIPPIVELPASYLPGSPLPLLAQDTTCFQSEYLSLSSCVVHVSGHKVYLSYKLGSRTIVRTGIRTREYAIGDLILNWGTPTGFTQHRDFIDIHWGSRSAFLYASSFRPDSRVEFIAYDPELETGAPWRGFTSKKR